MVTFSGTVYQSDVDKLRQYGFGDMLSRVTPDWSQIGFMTGGSMYYYSVTPGSRPSGVAPPGPMQSFLGWKPPSTPTPAPAPAPVTTINPTPTISQPSTPTVVNPATTAPVNNFAQQVAPAIQSTPIQTPSQDYFKSAGLNNVIIKGDYAFADSRLTTGGWAVYQKMPSRPGGWGVIEGGSSTAQISSRWLQEFGISQSQPGGGSLAAQKLYGIDPWQVAEKLNPTPTTPIGTSKTESNYVNAILGGAIAPAPKATTPVISQIAEPVSKRDADIARLSVFNQLTGVQPADVSKTGVATIFDVKVEKTSGGTQYTTTYTQPATTQPVKPIDFGAGFSVVGINQLDVKQDKIIVEKAQQDAANWLTAQTTPTQKAAQNLYDIGQSAKLTDKEKNAFVGAGARQNLFEFGQSVEQKWQEFISPVTSKIEAWAKESPTVVIPGIIGPMEVDRKFVAGVGTGIVSSPGSMVGFATAVPRATELFAIGAMKYPQKVPSVIAGGAVLMGESIKEDPGRFVGELIGSAVISYGVAKGASKIGFGIPEPEPGTTEYYSGLKLALKSPEKQKPADISFDEIVKMQTRALEMTQKSNKPIITTEEAIVPIGKFLQESPRVKTTTTTIKPPSVATALKENKLPDFVLDFIPKTQVKTTPKISTRIIPLPETTVFSSTKTIPKIATMPKMPSWAIGSAVGATQVQKVTPIQTSYNKLLQEKDMMSIGTPTKQQAVMFDFNKKSFENLYGTGISSSTKQGQIMDEFFDKSLKLKTGIKQDASSWQGLGTQLGLQTKQERRVYTPLEQKVTTSTTNILGLVLGTKTQTRLDTTTPIKTNLNQMLGLGLKQSTKLRDVTNIRQKLDTRTILETGIKTRERPKPPFTFTPLLPKTTKVAAIPKKGSDPFGITKIVRKKDVYKFRELAKYWNPQKAFGVTPKKSTRRRKK